MIEYIDECHTYLADGVLIPSVSNLVGYATGDDYSRIPSYILKQAQDFGTEIHEAIEKFITLKVMTNFESPYKNECFKEFIRLHEDFISDCSVCEKMIDYHERYAGRIDCISDTTLIDFKTNTNINIPHLEYQLSYYAMALESKGTKVDKLMCLWLPKRKSGKWVEIKRIPNEELLEILEEYENSRKFERSPY